MESITKTKLFSSVIFAFVSIFGFAQNSETVKFHDARGNIEVTKAGQLQYTLNIDTPPGVKNVSPNVSLVYTSGGQDGLAGFNWNLAGISSISRVGRNLDKDGINKRVQLDYSDYYSFNGQRLVLKSGEYGKDGATYETENYSNTKIKSVGPASGTSGASGPEYWEVTYPDGSQAWYGATGPGYNAARTPIDYNLVKLKDKDGNYITYNYDSSGNTSVISTIQWGGNELLNKPHFNKIEFSYKDRPIPMQAYINGMAIIQTRILDQVKVVASGSQYKKYALSYKKDFNETSYRYIEKISVYNSQNEESNPILFTSDTYGIDLTLPHNAGAYYGWGKTLKPNKNTDVVGDFDGDGNVDILRYHSTALPNVPTPGLYLYKNFYEPSNSYFIANYNPILINSSLDGLKDFIPVNYKKTNLIYNRQGIVGFKKINNPSTSKKDLQLSFYSISNNNSLVLDYVKTIPDIEKYNQNENPDPLEDFEPFGNKTLTILGLETHDFNGDGLNELLLRLNFRYCTQGSNDPNNPTVQSNFTPGSQCNDFKKFIAIDLDENLQNNNWFYPFDFGGGDYTSYRGGDFNGDGLSDLLKIDGNKHPILITIEKNDQGKYVPISTPFDTSNSAVMNGDWNNSYSGDFNGDGLSDIMMPLSSTSNMWTIYTSKGNGFTFETKQYVTPHAGREIIQSGDGRNITVINPRTFVAYDFNNDGKMELVAVQVNKHYNMKVEESNANSKVYLKNFGTIIDIFSTTGAKFPNVTLGAGLLAVTVDNNTINAELALKGDDYMAVSLNQLKGFMPVIVGSIIPYNYIFGDGQDIEIYRYYDVSRTGRITGITQGGVTTNITYKQLDKTINPGLYDNVKISNYPYVEINQSSGMYVVSGLTQSTAFSDKLLKQDFRYRGLTSHILGKGMIGFRQQARSSWYADGYENTKVWSGVEIDPENEGVPIKEWSIRTNIEANIFPSNISENNTQLLSLKLITYRVKNLLSDQQVTAPLSSSDKPKVVTVILPEMIKEKDFLTGSIVENTYTYGDYYLLSKSISKVNNSYSVKTTEYAYENNSSGAGADYYIGRLISKTENINAYGDTKSVKEDYTYENNRIKTIKKWNWNNTGYTIDTFTYGDFGNMSQRVSGSSIDAKTITSGFEYDPKGRFVTHQIDNLGLIKQSNYNDLGQVLSQTDVFGNTVINTYDNWGKLISSANSLSGTTTYTYERDNNYNVRIIRNDPDGNISETYTNKLGQVYKTSTKAFANTKFVFTESQYDIFGRKLKESEPYYDGQSASQWNVTDYNDSFYPAKVTSTSFNGKKVETSASGLITTVKELNGNLRTTTNTTDALGNVIATTDKGGMIQFSYNAAGQQIEAKYAENIVSTAYDQWGRKSQFNDPSNGVYMYEYDGLGRITKTISPKGYKEYTYNDFGQLISQSEFSEVDGGQTTNKKIGFSYNNKGQIILKEGTAGAQSFSSVFTYGPHGRLSSSIENSFGRTFSQKDIIYDDRGRISSYRKELKSSGIITGVDIESRYSEWNGELYQIRDKNTNKILWELKETNAKGQVKIASLGSSNIVNNYNANGFLNSIDHSSSIEPDILKISYSFDPLKNELQNRTTSGALSIIETFDYDDNNRLVNWRNPVTGIMPSANRNQYDIKGRILQNDQVGTMKYENTSTIYRSTGMTLNTEGEQNYDNDLIQTITYNENNDPVFIDGEKGDVGFQYGLTSMRQKVTYKGSFSSDAEGETTKFYNEDGSFEVVRDNKYGEEKHIIYIGGSPYDSNILYLRNSKEVPGAYHFLHKDYLGSILAITDEEGKRLEQRHFDAWGNLTHLQIGSSSVITDKAEIASTTLLIDRGYTGHEHFAVVGITHMNGRLYDPLLRRFLNADENIQDPANTQNYNKYGYVLNNPMMYSDPNGEVWWWLLGSLAGGYISGVQANGGQLNPVKWDWEKSWSAVLGGAIGGAAISGALGNIVNNIGAIKTVLPSIISGGLNSAFTGSNFLGGIVGGISYSGNIFDNKITSTDRMVESGFSSAGENFESAFYSPNNPPNLENEMWQAGLDPYDTKVWGRSDELMEKIPSIRKLANAIRSRRGVLEVIDVVNLPSAGSTNPRNFRISIKVFSYNNYTLLGYGYTLSHELIHAFDLQFNMSDWNRKYGSNYQRVDDLKAFREKRAYDYNKGQGMKLEGAQIDFYNKTVETIKNSRGLQDNLRYFQIINPWK